MKIFSAEQQIADSIRKNNTFASLSHVLPASEEERAVIVASSEENEVQDKNLFYHKAILVSTNWNKNDDIFTPEAVWEAKDTPLHKPTNFNHKSSKIVGHITSNWAIDVDGQKIDSETPVDMLPAKYHILTGAVIYKTFHNDPEYQESVENLISEILEGKQYVSMECQIGDFDYGVMEDDGTVSVIARNEETAFLSNYLRSYGGQGHYNDIRIGRVLKNVHFIGKAYTAKPANPESIIFASEECIDFSKKSTVLNTKGVHTSNKLILIGDQVMSDKNLDNELQAKFDEALAQIKALEEKLAQANTEKFTQKIEELEAELTQSKEALATKNAELETVQKSVAELNEKSDELVKANTDLQQKLEETEKAKVLANRISRLVDGGYTKESAEAKVPVFENLTEDQFDLIAEELINAHKVTKEQVAEADDYSDADENGEANVEDTDLDASTADESDTAEDTATAEADVDTDTVETIQAELVNFLNNVKSGDK